MTTNLEATQKLAQFGAGNFYFLTNDASTENKDFCQPWFYSDLYEAVRSLIYSRTLSPDYHWFLFDKAGYIVPSSEIEKV